jgi:hypothetical protein
LIRVTIHHRREAQFLSQSEQEMLLLGGMALFWIGGYFALETTWVLIVQTAALVAWRGMRGGGETKAGAAGGGGGGYQRDWGCRPDDVYCMVEEYRYW